MYVGSTFIFNQISTLKQRWWTLTINVVSTLIQRWCVCWVCIFRKYLQMEWCFPFWYASTIKEIDLQTFVFHVATLVLQVLYLYKYFNCMILNFRNHVSYLSNTSVKLSSNISANYNSEVNSGSTYIVIYFSFISFNKLFGKKNYYDPLKMQYFLSPIPRFMPLTLMLSHTLPFVTAQKMKFFCIVSRLSPPHS